MDGPGVAFHKQTVSSTGKRNLASILTGCCPKPFGSTCETRGPRQGVGDILFPTFATSSVASLTAAFRPFGCPASGPQPACAVPATAGRYAAQRTFPPPFEYRVRPSVLLGNTLGNSPSTLDTFILQHWCQDLTRYNYLQYNTKSSRLVVRHGRIVAACGKI